MLAIGETLNLAKASANARIAMLHDEDILKGEAMIAGPSCPLHLGLLDSPDYWTDDALISSASLESRRTAPLSHRIPTTKKAEEGQRGID